MELDLLPDNILLNVIGNLDLLQLVRCTRVSRRWNELCFFAIETEIRHFDLSDRSYWRLSTESLASILRLCSRNLRSIRFPILKNRNIPPSRQSAPDPPEKTIDPYIKLNVTRWCQILGEFRLPNLRSLNLGDATTDRNCIEGILASNSTLEVFQWLTPDPNGIAFGGSQQSTWTSSALRRVNLGCLFATDALFATLAGNCPELERFTANSHFRQWTAAGFDRFCGACRGLKTLNLKVSSSLESTGIYIVPLLFDPPKLTTDLMNFWSLGQLRYLSLPFEGGLFDDEALYKISLCFPEMHTLKFGDSNLSSDGVANLCRLKQLRRLTMAQVTGTIDEGLLRLAVENRLKELNLALTQISFPTLRAVLHNCTRLRSLNISHNVSNYQVHRGTVVSVQQALQIIQLRRRMSEMGECEECFTLIHSDPGVWTSATVRSALERMPAGAGQTFRVVLLNDYCKAKRDDADDCNDEEEFE